MLINYQDLLFFPKKVKGIIHIGAHELEELPFYVNKGIKKVIWIEANPQKYKFIEEKLSFYNEMKLGKFAAGSSEKIKVLNIANNGESSSLLNFGTHKSSYPHIKFISNVKVKIMALDDWLKKNIKDKTLYNFINIDIQGYELEALKGMTSQLLNVDYIYLEVNFGQVYENCSELKEVDEFLSKFNFKRVCIKKTKFGWGDAIYTKNFIFMHLIFYYIFLPLNSLPKIFLKAIKKILRIFKSL